MSIPVDFRVTDLTTVTTLAYCACSFTWNWNPETGRVSAVRIPCTKHVDSSGVPQNEPKPMTFTFFGGEDQNGHFA